MKDNEDELMWNDGKEKRIMGWWWGVPSEQYENKVK